MVGAEVSAAPVPVEKRSQVREIAVEVNVLGVRPTIGPTVQQVTLKRLTLESAKNTHGNSNVMPKLVGAVTLRTRKRVRLS